VYLSKASFNVCNWREVPVHALQRYVRCWDKTASKSAGGQDDAIGRKTDAAAEQRHAAKTRRLLPPASYDTI